MNQLIFPVVACLGAVLGAQDFTIAAVAQNGSSAGLLCAPVTCVPDPMTAVSGTPVQVRLRGAFDPMLLILSVEPPSCIAIPGIVGNLMAPLPGAVDLLTVAWGHFYVTVAPGSPPPCDGWIGFSTLLLPAGLPSGLQVRMQVLAPAGSQWAFSNAVEITVQ